MNELALFHGGGGGLIASRMLGWRTVCGVEIDPYCREVVLRRQEEKEIEPFPIWDDVKTFDGTLWKGAVQVVTGGFPCQPFSGAGRQLGEQDERNLWPETLRIIREVRPQFAYLENVPGLLVSGYFGRILGDLAESGYNCRWRILSAAEMGAPHKRDRLWIMAYSKGGQNTCGGSKKISNSTGKRFQNRRGTSMGQSRTKPKFKRPNSNRRQWWSTEPRLGRVANGVAYRVDRLKAIGNGQVPQCFVKAWELLTEGIFKRIV